MMNWFNSFLNLDGLRDCLANSTGKGVSVGVLDTGVASELPKLRGCVAGNYDVVADRGRVRVEKRETGEDRLQHGTACAYIINQLAPDAKIYNVRVIGGTHRDTTKKLLAGLEFAVQQKWDILNLSLSTEANQDRLLRLVDQAYYQGTLVIAAKDNRKGRIGFPAAFSSVVAVDMDHFKDPLDFRYLRGKVTELEASGVYIEAPCPDGTMQSFTGTSFACPQVAGIAARLREKIQDLSPFQLRTILAALAQDG